MIFQTSTANFCTLHFEKSSNIVLHFEKIYICTHNIGVPQSFEIISGFLKPRNPTLKKGQRNGRGRYWFAKDDSCLKGIWINDVFKSGIYTSKDQEIKDRREHSNVEILEEFKNQEDLSSSTTTSYEIKKSVEAATTQTDISGNVISAAEPPAQCG